MARYDGPIVDCHYHVKIPGLALLSWRSTPDDLRFVIGETVEVFGPERVVYGSNFPLEKMWATYDDLCNAVRDALSDRPVEDQRRILHDNAMDFYQLSDSGS